MNTHGVDIVRSVSDPGRMVYRGLYHCRNPWQCPVCVAGIVTPRMRFLEDYMKRHRRGGGECYLLTLTTSHRAYHDARKMRQLVTEAHRRMRQGRAAQRREQAFGIVDNVRSLELTHSPDNGFHPHLHQLVFTARPLEPAELEALQSWLWLSWASAIDTTAKKMGLEVNTPSLAHGVVLSPAATDAKYLAKMGLVAELLLAPNKKGRAGHRTNWQVLSDICDADDRANDESLELEDRRRAAGDRDVDVAIWRDMIRATERAQYITFSPRTRKLFNVWLATRQLELRLDDGGAPPRPVDRGESWESPLLFEDVPKTAGAVVYRIDAKTWDAVLQTRDRRMQLLLRIAEDTGPPGCDAVLDLWKGVPLEEIQAWAPPAVVDRIRFWLRISGGGESG